MSRLNYAFSQLSVPERWKETGMTCLVGCLALAFPRIAIILVAIFSTYLSDAYQTILWPVLGFLFLPLTTLAYAFAINSNGSVAGWYLVVVVVAVLFDLGLLGTGGNAGKRYRRVNVKGA